MPRTHAHPEFSQRKIFEVFESEREYLIPYASAFDGFRSSQVRVSKTCLVRFDNNSYSVSAQVAGQSVEVYGYAERVVIRKDGEVVGDHKRLFGKGNTVYDAVALPAGADAQAGCITKRSAVSQLGTAGTGAEGSGASVGL